MSSCKGTEHRQGSSTQPRVGSTCYFSHRAAPSRFPLVHGELLFILAAIKANLSPSATALQSIEIACDTLLSGKAKIMLAGGFDDLSEEGSYEFANMKATSNAETEFAMGREPTEMSRPATTTRSGVRAFHHPLQQS